DREAEAIHRRLLRDDVRLITITGAGGTGKTRLGVHVASEVRRQFPDGVWFVPLESLDSAALVPSAIAQAVAIRDPAPDHTMATIAERLGGRRLLLVIDNVEHVIDAAPTLASLLDSVAGLKILATSQVPL